MKRSIMLAALCGLITLSCSHKKEKPKEYEVMRTTETETAKVSDVDYTKRTITMETNEGPVTMKAGEEIRNLDQIKKGDTVKAEYTTALAYSIDKNGVLNDPEYKSGTWRAKKGEQPGAGVNAQVTASAIITDINRSAPSVTLRNGAGDEETFKVAHPERLKDLKIGDAVHITYSEAMALKVEKTNSASY